MGAESAPKTAKWGQKAPVKKRICFISRDQTIKAKTVIDRVETAGEANLSGCLLSGHKGFQENSIMRLSLNMRKQKDKSNEKARESAEKHHGNPDKEKDKEATPFR